MSCSKRYVAKSQGTRQKYKEMSTTLREANIYNISYVKHARSPRKRHERIIKVHKSQLQNDDGKRRER